MPGNATKPRRGSRRAGRFPSRLHLWLGAVAAGLILVVGVVGWSLQSAEQGAPRLVADRTTHDFGHVKMNAGLLRTSFSLSIQGAPLVTGLATN